MKAKDIIGKRIRSVRQEQIPAHDKHQQGPEWALLYITFTDGSVLHLQAQETEHMPYVEGRLSPARKAGE